MMPKQTQQRMSGREAQKLIGWIVNFLHHRSIPTHSPGILSTPPIHPLLQQNVQE
jgi:hypothetical protein